MRKLILGLGLAGMGWVITTTVPQRLPAEPARPLLSPAQEKELITTVSQQMATALETQSCQEFSALLTKAQASRTQTSTNISLIDQAVDQLLVSVRNQAELRSILVANVGTPLINKLIDCRMVPINAWEGTAELLQQFKSKEVEN